MFMGSINSKGYAKKSGTFRAFEIQEGVDAGACNGSIVSQLVTFAARIVIFINLSVYSSICRQRLKIRE